MANYDGTFSATNYGHILRLVVNQAAQSVPNNTSTVSWALYAIKNTNYGGWSSSGNNWSVNINGTGYGGAFTHNFSGQAIGYTILIASGSTVVSHNSDGTKTISVSSSAHSTVWGNASNSGSLSLTTIPRASVPTFSPNPVEAGNELTVTTNRLSSSFTHDITYTFGSASGTIGTGVGASTTWTPPLSLLSEIPNNTSGTVQVTTVTKSGSTAIGSKVTSFTLAAPSSVVPDFTTVTHEEATTSPDVDTIVGAYVRGISSLAVALTGAVGAYGSTVVSKKIELIKGSTVLHTINGDSGTTGAVSESGSLTLRGTVTDSRGRSYSKDVSVSVLSYAVPVIPAYAVSRCTVGGTLDPNGDYMKVDLEAAVQSLVVGTQRNSLTWRIKTRERGDDTDWASITADDEDTTSSTGFDDDIILGTYATSESFDVLIEVEDALGSITAVLALLSTGGVQLHLSKTEDGVGVGKYHEQGSLDALDQIYQRNGKRVLDEDDYDTLDSDVTTIETTLSTAYLPREILYFTSSGVFEKADYPWLRALRVRVQGAGGAGGGSQAASSGQFSYGTGGGGGGYAESFITDISGLDTSITVTVGAGGTAVTGASGNQGGESSFADTTYETTASGGGGGSTKPNTNLAFYVPGGFRGEGSAGDLLLSGSGGDGGGGVGSLAIGGKGGSSHMGGGARANGSGAGGGSAAGITGGNYGGGGGGGSTNASGSAQAGGAGAPGIVIVELYA